MSIFLSLISTLSDLAKNIKYFARVQRVGCFAALSAQIIMAVKSISTGNYGGLCVLKNEIMVIKDVGVE